MCTAERLSAGASATLLPPNGAKMYWKTPLPDMVNQKSSTPIRVPNIPVLYGRSTWNPRAFKYPWTEKAGPWIISGSNGSGNQSSMTTFIYIPPKMVLNFMKEFKTISATTMKKYTTQHFKHLMTDMKYPSEMQPDL